MTNVDALWQKVRDVQAALDALKEEIQDVVDDIEAGPRLRAHEREDLEDLIVALRGELAVARGEAKLEDADISELETMASTGSERAERPLRHRLRDEWIAIHLAFCEWRAVRRRLADWYGFWDRFQREFADRTKWEDRTKKGDEEKGVE